MEAGSKYSWRKCSSGLCWKVELGVVSIAVELNTMLPEDSAKWEEVDDENDDDEWVNDEYTLLTILHGLWTPSTPKKSRQRLYFLHQLRKFRASAPISCVSWQHHLVWELYSLWLQHRIIRASLHILQETYKKRLTYQRPRYCKGFLTSWPWTFQNTEVRQTSLLLQDQNRETEEELLSSSIPYPEHTQWL